MSREARDSVRLLLRRRERLHVVLQVMFEFWVVATRPIANNGLGMAAGMVSLAALNLGGEGGGGLDG